MTVTELYKSHADVRGLIDSWVNTHEYPIGLADLFRELDMPAAADCGDWCARQPLRTFGLEPTTIDRHASVFPWCFKPPHTDVLEWHWITCSDADIHNKHSILRNDCDGIPLQSVTPITWNMKIFPDSRTAIIALLNNWKTGDWFVDIVDAKVGLRLRYFTAHAFGVLVEGTITHVNPKMRTVTIDGPHKPEICGLERGFYHPRGHPNQGDKFKLIIPPVKTKD